MVEIAKCNRVGKQYVSWLIRLAFLAPEMVERIVAGRQPPELTAQALRDRPCRYSSGLGGAKAGVPTKNSLRTKIATGAGGKRGLP